MDIFKSYDIRGIFPNEINEYITQRIGTAFAKFLTDNDSNAKRIVVGRDMRSSSRSLANALIDGIKSLGLNVIDLGLVSTEMTYYAVGFYNYDAGIMVTASHNPAKYNGFKLCREKAIPISADTGLLDIAQITTRVLPGMTNQTGRVTSKDIYNDYKKFVLSFLNKQLKPLKIVVDAGNGMAGKVITAIFNSIPCEIIPLYFELDGSFPNHDANPLDHRTLVDLRKTVIKKRADFGVAFDGDADRCVFIDETGNIVTSDITTIIIAKKFLSGSKDEKIIYDLRLSKAVAEEINASGGIPIREKVGHSHIKARMRAENAVFAGELSGHFYYKDNFFADSAMITLINIINILSTAKQPMSKLIAPFKKYFASGEINFEVDNKDDKIKQLAEEFPNGQIDYMDGITIQHSDWWFNVRKSNTEPLLRLNLEAKTKKIFDSRIKTVTDIIKSGK